MSRNADARDCALDSGGVPERELSFDGCILNKRARSSTDVSAVEGIELDTRTHCLFYLLRPHFQSTLAPFALSPPLCLEPSPCDLLFSPNLPTTLVAQKDRFTHRAAAAKAIAMQTLVLRRREIFSPSSCALTPH